MSNLEIKQSIVDAVKGLYQKNFFAGCDGNISYKIDNNLILITSTQVPKRCISTRDFSYVDGKGDPIEGQPSSEKSMHVGIYNECPKAKFIIHAHPPTAISITLSKPNLTELPHECMSEIIISMGTIPIAPYARPGTKQMFQNIRSFLPEIRNIILARHGAISWGETLDEAINGMEGIEHASQIIHNSLMLGGYSNLPQEEIDFLKEIMGQEGGQNLLT